ncbi:hypothetical protein CDL12_26103 [Handroanthus impetiginosus]|uniref:Uncharacterized protein n=1 Tax=Handroanthus impetiginosus TaxID=429701 RepID=A0A2G9G847_9LAMI|nr:hypothetical protein CDL12_26103 [Handroanthus impetiginosus]
MDDFQEDVNVCPSFNSYSSNRLAEIAVRVAVEKSSDAAVHEGDGGDEDFEFSLVRDDKEVLAEDFFYDGQIGPIYPVFNRDLLLNNDGDLSKSGEKEHTESIIAIPLSKLFIEEDQERDYPPSCSSSEADELDNIPAGTYCVWRPKMAESPMPSQCKKSKSTGSTSKRWKFRDLMRRSNSDGKDSFVFLTPKHRDEKSEKLIQAPKKSKGKGVPAASGGATGSASAHEAFYVRNRAMKEGDKRKSYLPYRLDLVGFFANVNGLRRGFPHF